MITSPQNSKLKLVRALVGRAKERREANAFVVEGVRLIEEAVNAGWNFRFALYSDGLSKRGQALIETLSAKNIEVDDVASDLLQKLSDTENPQGILAVLESWLFHRNILDNNRKQLQEMPLLQQRTY